MLILFVQIEVGGVTYLEIYCVRSSASTGKSANENRDTHVFIAPGLTGFTCVFISLMLFTTDRIMFNIIK